VTIVVAPTVAGTISNTASVFQRRPDAVRSAPGQVSYAARDAATEWSPVPGRYAAASCPEWLDAGKRTNARINVCAGKLGPRVLSGRPICKYPI
jgi:hypothetical protein